jgi:aspartate ammonia-lyase
MTTRKEHDLLGERQIPENEYWGIHTLRAKENFVLSPLRSSPALIKAMAMIKKACCEANLDLGFLDGEKAGAIAAACDEVVSGGLANQFPLDALQGGAGTSTNMNVNEVIANRALEIMGHAHGDYATLHPLDHVNLHQSTNDVYPTALKIAAIYGVRNLSEAAAALQGALQKKEAEFSSIVTMGRTEMQYAVPMTLGSQFASFAEAAGRDRWRTFKCEERLRVVTIGGTAIGTGLAAPKSYINLVVEKLRAITGLGLTRAENMIDQTANADSFVEVAGMIAAHASNLQKICNDLRMLHFLRDIILPPVQAGSSIMPGKVNPVICEAAIIAAVKVKADAAIVTETASMGTFQINEFLPLLSHGLLEAIDILAAADRMLAKHVAGIEADAHVCRRHVEESPTIITAFLPVIGYEAAQKLIKEFPGSGVKRFKAFLEERLGKELVDRMLTHQNLMALGHSEPNAADKKRR